MSGGGAKGIQGRWGTFIFGGGSIEVFGRGGVGEEGPGAGTGSLLSLFGILELGPTKSKQIPKLRLRLLFTQ